MRAARLLALAAGLAALLVTVPLGAADDPSDAATEARTAYLELYGGGATAIVAEALGVEEIGGKVLDAQTSAKSTGIASASSGSGSGPITEHRPGRSANNFGIRDFPNVSENEPTVVANPREPKRLVAGTHFIGDTLNRCVAHYSRDGGKTWSLQPIFMPQLTHDSGCSDPVLAYAPDGSRVYYAYMDLDTTTSFKILVSYSDDDGKSWHGPVVALSNATADYDKPWIGTHVPVGGGGGDDDDDGGGGGGSGGARQGNSKWVYVSSTRFNLTNSTADCHIDFTRSSDKGTTWSAAQTLDSGNCSAPGGLMVPQGSRPQGGLGSGVIVAWYHSSTDGFRTGTFEIRTRYSADNGATFAPTVMAATDSFELQLFLGPAFAYHRWWGGMFPDVEIAPNGSAHIAYAHDPEAGSTVEDGDIRYIGSATSPYIAWSAPTTVNDDASGKAQGWATLEAGYEKGKVLLYALWEDHRSSASENLYYDVFWAKRTGSGTPGPWAPNTKLTDAQAPSDFFFLGDYYDVALARDGNDPFVYGVWTDRRDEEDVFDFDDDIWGARLGRSSGGGD